MCTTVWSFKSTFTACLRVCNTSLTELYAFCWTSKSNCSVDWELICVLVFNVVSNGLFSFNLLCFSCKKRFPLITIFVLN